MKHSLKIVLFVLLLCGVFGADEVKPVSVMEADSVTLTPDPAKIQGFIKLQWWFGDTLIAQTRKTESSIEYEDIFRDRLQLDHQTGSLTIKNMRTKHSGPYQLKIDYSDTNPSYIEFKVTVKESPFVDAIEFVMKTESVTEGDPVTLHVPQIQGDELIVWRFGDEGKLIAKHDLEAKSSPLYYDEERFSDRLKLDQTGSLTITNTRTTDSGFYTVKISSNKPTLYKRFTVTVNGE
uniref:Ig-like domain-containing protein n=1 Tax=Cyprinus carpio TaxID=7962 RepID=A0A8C1LTA6_CYPCA